MSRYSLTDEQLNNEIRDSDNSYLAQYFDDVTIYSNAMGLTPAEQADVNELYHKRGTQVAMTECLTIWKQHNPYAATHRALLELLLRLRKEKIADDICQHLTQCEYNHICIYYSCNVYTMHTHAHFIACVLYITSTHYNAAYCAGGVTSGLICTCIDTLYRNICSSNYNFISVDCLLAHNS